VKNILLSATLLSTLLFNTSYSDASSIRSISKDTLPGFLANTLIELTDDIDFSTIEREMEANGETQKVVLQEIGLNGSIGNVFSRDMDKIDYMKGDDYLIRAVPFRISKRSDGSFSREIGIFGFKGSAQLDNTDLLTWISVEKFKVFNWVEGKDEFLGTEDKMFEIFATEFKLGLLQDRKSNHNLFLKLGLSVVDHGFRGDLGRQRQVLTADDKIINMYSGSIGSKIGLHYSYGSQQDLYFEIGAGIEKISSQDDAFTITESDKFIYEEALSDYNFAKEEYEIQKENFKAEIAEYETENEIEAGSLSFSEYTELTGIAAPKLDLNSPEQGYTDISYESSHAYGMVKLEKRFPSARIRTSFFVDAKKQLDNKLIIGDENVQLKNTNQVNATFRIEY
jgi:hypothetical protein